MWIREVDSIYTRRERNGISKKTVGGEGTNPSPPTLFLVFILLHVSFSLTLSRLVPLKLF